MTWYAWLLVGYVALDRFLTVAVCGRGFKIEVTPTFAAVSLVTGALIVWGIVSLAGAA